ncbi:MAG TPA: SDR family oxidoreductase [Terriglobales bacterium]|nr:SDR family oxidoreductase [Terriglobales bacterium]
MPAWAPCVLVTGATSGIGAACVQRFLAEGWAVAALARRTAPLEQLAAAHAGRVLPLAADVTQAAAVRDAVERVRAWRQHPDVPGQPGRPAPLDAVVQAAGDFLVAPMERTSAAEFERIWRLTVWAKFYLTRELLPLLTRPEAAPPRALVHLASLAAHADFPDETAYTSAMHGVLGLARAQDAELRGRGLRVSVVSPGLVRTPLTERHFPPAALAHALPPGAIADSVFGLVRTIRAGGYIQEIFHTPGEAPRSAAPVLQKQ